MNKAEELRQEFIEDWQPSDSSNSIQNQNFVFELDRLLDFVFELDRLLDEVSRERCDGCVFSYHDKSKGSHDVEDLYKEQEEQ